MLLIHILGFKADQNDVNLNTGLRYSSFHKKSNQKNWLLVINSTDTGKLIEHIYGFLKIVERILTKYDEKNSGNQSGSFCSPESLASFSKISSTNEIFPLLKLIFCCMRRWLTD